MRPQLTQKFLLYQVNKIINIRKFCTQTQNAKKIRKKQKSTESSTNDSDNSSVIDQYILNVAEKPSVAHQVSFYLSNGQNKKFKTLSKTNPNYEFQFDFKGNKSIMRFTSVLGHIMNMEFPEEYRWKQNQILTLLNEAPIVRKTSRQRLDIVKNLQNLAKQSQVLILWLDCDREGENIAYEVIQVCQKVNPQISIFRARFSALTKRDIETAMLNLEQPNPDLSKAVDVRQEIDLRIGSAFTVFQTFTLQPRFQALSSSIISYGPCQFPTLGFVVERYKQIQNFVPQTYWKIVCKLLVQNTTVNLEFKKGQIQNQDEANKVYSKCMNNPKAIITNIQKQPVTKKRLYPLSTIEFQKIVSKKLKISSDKAMEYAEKLYNKGYISYPRTETNQFANTINIKNLVSIQTKSTQWGNYATKLMDDQYFHYPKKGNKDDKAHPPIHPVKLLDNQTVYENDEWKIYQFITQHFLACCSRDAQAEETIVDIQINNEEFQAKGLRITQINYLEIYPYDKWEEYQLPEFEINQQFRPSELLLKELQTTPPYLLTESELISLMDKNGIGTDSTIHEHIKTIFERGYIQKISGGLFQPTKLGLSLVNAYEEMGFDLAKPTLRTKMEQNMTLIAEGKMSSSNALSESLTIMENILKNILDSKTQILIKNVSRFFEESPALLETQQNNSMQTFNNVGNCAKCGNILQLNIQKNKSNQIICSNCQIKLPLPRQGTISLNDSQCPICQFQVLNIQNGHKQYQICPWCFTNPPSKEVELMPCFKCEHNECQFSAINKQQKILMKCFECQTGNLKLKKTKQNTYLFGCSLYPKCTNVINLPSNIQEVNISENICKKCEKNQVFGKETHIHKISLKATDLEKLPEQLFAQIQANEEFCIVCQSDFVNIKPLQTNNNTNNDGLKEECKQNTNETEAPNKQSAKKKTIIQDERKINKIQNNRLAYNSKEDENVLQNITCFICKQTGHYANKCPNKSKILKNTDTQSKNLDKATESPENDPTQNNNQENICPSCGNVGIHPESSQCLLLTSEKDKKIIPDI